MEKEYIIEFSSGYYLRDFYLNEEYAEKNFIKILEITAEIDEALTFKKPYEISNAEHIVYILRAFFPETRLKEKE